MSTIFINFISLSKKIYSYSKNKYFKNINYLLMEKFIRFFTSYFVTIWMARYLGPENMGMLNYSISLVFIFSFFTNLIVEGIAIKEMANNKNQIKQVMGSIFFVNTFGFIFFKF